MAEATVTIKTNRCIFCHNTGSVEVTPDEYVALQGGLHIQDALSSRSPGFREQVFTGIHDACWKDAFPPEDE